MTLEELRERAASGALSRDEVHLVAGHMGAEHPPAVRSAALEIAALQLRHDEDPELLVQVIAMGEDKRPEHDSLRSDAIRLLARTTEYHGQRIQIDL